jgi:acylphosphatase
LAVEENERLKAEVSVRARIAISGRVQGVGFRWSAQTEARRLGLLGWVRNLSNGTVEVLAEGTRMMVEALVEWCKTGPSLGRVTAVDVRWKEATEEFDDFDILRTAHPDEGLA